MKRRRISTKGPDAVVEVHLSLAVPDGDTWDRDELGALWTGLTDEVRAASARNPEIYDTRVWFDPRERDFHVRARCIDFSAEGPVPKFGALVRSITHMLLNGSRIYVAKDRAERLEP